MCASTTKNTHWSGWVEPQATTPESEAALSFAPRQPGWVYEMVPMFGVTSYTPTSKCSHNAEIARGSKFYCAAPGCDKSGMDYHPALKRDPATDPKPEPKHVAAPLTAESAKQRRKRERREAARLKHTRAA